MRHSLKNSRYKIAFQTKNKVWIYKNSRLRNFYKIRSKIIMPITRRARRFLVTKNMKWTVARRQMIPYFRKTKKYIYYYKKLFFTKQQLKNFYGKLKEYQMRNFFKRTWNKEHLFRTNIFIGSLEQRISVILYRMRLLPTIFACNQLIQHKGLLVNNQLITFLYYKVNLGDIISIPKDYWFMFYQFLYERLAFRFLGEGYAVYRKNLIVKKLQKYFIKSKEFFYNNLNLARFCGLQIKKSLLIKNILKKLYIDLKKNFSNKNVIWLKILNFYFLKKIFKKLKNLRSNLKFLRFWGKTQIYLKKIRFFWYNLLHLNFQIQNFYFLVENFLTKIVFNNELNLDLYNKIFIQKKYKNILIQNSKYSIFYNKLIWKKRKYFFPQIKSRYIIWLLRRLKYKKQKKNFFKQFCKNLQWYTPKYLEVDYNTLRTIFIYYPEPSEIFFSFKCSFKKLISFYKERAL